MAHISSVKLSVGINCRSSSGNFGNFQAFDVVKVFYNSIGLHRVFGPNGDRVHDILIDNMR